MNINIASALLAVFLLQPAPSRAQEENEEAAPQAETAAKPEVAAAARNKGYHAEAAVRTSTAEDEDAPVVRRPVQGSFTPPPQRPLGKAERAAAAAGGGSGSASGGGIACEKSVPKVAAVHKREIDFFDKIHRGNVIRFALAPNEAASWRFKTPDSGSGLIEQDMAPFATPVPSMLTISRTPCDFDIAKAKSKTKENIFTTACYQLNPNGGSVAFQIAPAKAMGYGCVLQPNTDYYFSVRALANDGHDTCADVTLPNPRCGGIWAAHGNFKWKDDAALSKAVNFKINDSAHIGWQP